MITKKFKLLAMLAGLFVFSSFLPGDKVMNQDEALLRIIFENLNSSHFLAMNINDDFSQKSFDLYLKRLDANKRFLTRDDVETFKKYRNLIDDEINAGSLEFFDLSFQLFDKRVKEAEQICKDVLSNPFDFTVNESVETDPDKKDFPKDLNCQKEEWRKMLKYEVLARIDDQLGIQEKAEKDKDTTVKIQPFAEIEKDAREKTLKKYDEWFKRIAKEDRNDKFSIYINCLTNVYDPHTGYFPPKDKENFDIQMSGQLEGIGATLQERDSYIKIVSIVPGSPSWKSGQIKEGDFILKVAQANEDPVDLVDMRLDDAVKLIRGKKGTTVTLTIKKPDNSIVQVPLVRDVIIIEETFAKSAVLELPGSHNKIGYIYLPSFYADFDKHDGRRCSKDVKAELEKLKNQNISGLIFDLRNDGGGSLQDAVEIAGMFIEKGPIVQVKSRFGSPYVFEDKDPQIDYDGPLMVMVNSYSASASEIFAAAMQDYGRGVIVGTPSTFGKGTVQRFVDLDRYALKNTSLKDLGSLKVTIQKFYRINGGSTQLKGVTPDVTFPDAYAFIDRGEKEADYPMQWTRISPVPYNAWNNTLPVDDIRNMINDRIKRDSTMILIAENAERLKELKDKSVIPLNLAKYREMQKNIKADTKRFERINKDTTDIRVIALPDDILKSKKDSASEARFATWQKNLKKDSYLYNTAIALDKNVSVTKR